MEWCKASLEAKAHVMIADIVHDDILGPDIDINSLLEKDGYLVTTQDTADEYQRTPDVILIDMRDIRHVTDEMLDDVKRLKTGWPKAAIMFLTSLSIPYSIRMPLRHVGIVISLGKKPDPLLRRLERIVVDINLTQECSLRMQSFNRFETNPNKRLAPPNIPDRHTKLRVLISGKPSPASLDAIRLLENEGVTAHAALTAPQTLRYLEAKPFDCLIFMPGTKNATFISLLKLLRRHDVGKTLPIIVLTQEGHTPLSVGEKFLIHGADLSLSTNDIGTALINELTSLARKNRLHESLNLFMKNSVKHASDNLMGITAVSYFETHVSALAQQSKQNSTPFVIGAFRLEKSADCQFNGKTTSDRAFTQAMVYAGMVTRDIDLVTKASHDLLLIAFPFTTYTEADQLRERIIGVLNDLRFNQDDNDGKYETLNIHSAIALYNPNVHVEETIARAVKNMKATFGRKKNAPAHRLKLVT